MPRTRSTFRRRRRRTFRRRRGIRRFGKRRFRKGGRAHMKIIKAPSGMVDRAFVKLKYCTIVNRIDAGGLNNYVFRANSCYDPDFTLGGHQPFYFDQWCNANTFFNRYRVHGCKIIVKFTNNKTTAISVGLYPSLSNAGPTGGENVAEIPYSKQTVIAGTEGTPQATLSQYMSTKRMFGVQSISQNEGTSAAYNADPLAPWYWMINVQTAVGIAGLDFVLDVKLIMMVEFYIRTQVSQS